MSIAIVRPRLAILSLALGLWCLEPTMVAANPLGLLPTPKQIQVTGGDMTLTAESRIVAAEAKLKPLADIFSREVLILTKLRLQPVKGQPKPVKARYVRVNMLKNSIQNAVQVVEVRVYEVGK